ncbi:hypothetical protein [Desulfoluna spongiiphila]|uniref:hypothetical protein n=1 Tax=Desulfoluna spongiiphila TaxID=419481 RepID=UPI00186A56F4|nr:hypothetical protein [Desulfoluna spongiiphila]
MEWLVWRRNRRFVMVEKGGDLTREVVAFFHGDGWRLVLGVKPWGEEKDDGGGDWFSDK